MKSFCWIMLVAASVGIARPVHAAPGSVGSRFDEMKALVGVWRQADNPAASLRIRFSLTAGGTVLVEEWLQGTRPHSLTLYHRNGQDMIATHYCPQGNQPRLVLTAASSHHLLSFAFRDATGLDTARESHLVALAFDLSDEGQITRSETYRQADIDEPSTMVLVRD